MVSPQQWKDIDLQEYDKIMLRTTLKSMASVQYSTANVGANEEMLCSTGNHV